MSLEVWSSLLTFAGSAILVLEYRSRVYLRRRTQEIPEGAQPRARVMAKYPF